PFCMYENPGLDADVSSGASAQAVYAGTVSGVYMIPGFSTVVIVNHGEYYTVYGNLGSAAVKVGDRVKQGQTVGKVTTDPDNPGHSEIHFEVWKGKEKQNPAAWIR
ncbi:MAG: M23 family metallopeptidase, partial [Muribaculaceae bacterium]|nr:M23 family metallopeptidase [Muribaculaceae bacterium]